MNNCYFCISNLMYMRQIGITLFALLMILLYSCKGDPTKQESIIHIRLKKDPERINPLIFPQSHSSRGIPVHPLTVSRLQSGISNFRADINQTNSNRSSHRYRQI